MKDSFSMETVLITENEALSDSQVTRQNSVRVNEFEPGKYLFIPMTHFCVDVIYNGDHFASKRVLAFKLNKKGDKVEYARTWKISYFTESLTALKSNGAPVIKAEPNAQGLLRIPRDAEGVEYTFSTRDRIPKSVTDDNYLHIDRAFIIDYKGTIQGYMPEYERVSAGGGYNVKVNEAGNVVFQSARITQFNVLADEVSDDLIAQAKDVLSKDSQLNEVDVD